MGDEDLGTRLRKIENQFAYLTGAAVVGLAAILAFWGLTNWRTIPSAVEMEVEKQIGAETRAKIDEAERKASSILEASALVIPKGAVVAFQLPECPDGWSPYEEAAGRTVIGVGEGDDLTARALNEMGGAETVKLETKHMPAHSHFPESKDASFIVFLREKVGNMKSNPKEDSWWNYDSKTREAGEDKPHENMPPFVALLYCRRE